MGLNALFKLVQDCELAFIKMAVQSNDFGLSHEVRNVALALEEGKFREARVFIRWLASDRPSPALIDDVLLANARFAKEQGMTRVTASLPVDAVLSFDRSSHAPQFIGIDWGAPGGDLTSDHPSNAGDKNAS